jgi:hypothetical protein
MASDLKAAAVRLLACWDGDPLSQETILAVEHLRAVVLSGAERAAERTRRFLGWLGGRGGASHIERPDWCDDAAAGELRRVVLKARLAEYDRDARLRPTAAGRLYCGRDAGVAEQCGCGVDGDSEGGCD